MSVPPSRPKRRLAALFDLDGTLVETRQDIATGVNEMLAEAGLGPLSVDQVSRHVGRGSRILVSRCLQECGVPTPDPDQIDGGYSSFLRHYSDHLLDTTVPYPGIESMCERLERAGIEMAIVSNKPEDPSRRILEGIGLARYFSVILGGDSLPVRKPDPAPLLHALARMGNPEAAVMVGDSEIDIAAARAAGLPVAAVMWGFGSPEELEAAGPDRLVSDADELTAWILG